MTTSDRLACWGRRWPTWAKRRSCCSRGKRLLDALAGKPFAFYKCLPPAVPPRLSRSRSSSPISRLSRSSSPRRSTSPTRAQLTNSSRHARLLSHFNDLYSVVRLEAQSLLRRYITDLETVQKIIFVAVTVGFASELLVGLSRSSRVF